jgi:hypothetical protein
MFAMWSRCSSLSLHCFSSNAQSFTPLFGSSQNVWMVAWTDGVTASTKNRTNFVLEDGIEIAGSVSSPDIVELSKFLEAARLLVVVGLAGRWKDRAMTCHEVDGVFRHRWVS